MRKIIEPKVDPCETDAKLSIQYKAAVAITGAIQGTSPEKICQELGLECLNLEDGISASVACSNNE